MCLENQGLSLTSSPSEERTGLSTVGSARVNINLSTLMALVSSQELTKIDM